MSEHRQLRNSGLNYNTFNMEHSLANLHTWNQVTDRINITAELILSKQCDQKTLSRTLQDLHLFLVYVKYDPNTIYHGRKNLVERGANAVIDVLDKHKDHISPLFASQRYHRILELFNVLLHPIVNHRTMQITLLIFTIARMHATHMPGIYFILSHIISHLGK